MEREGLTAGCKWLLLLPFTLLAASFTSEAAVTNLYSTGFEVAEGYDPNFDLEGQQGWVGTGTNSMGDNGLITGYLPGLGQHAYVGFGPLAAGEDVLFVWQPLNHTSSSNRPIVRFSVRMMIVDSTSENGQYDSFRWSVYNSNAEHLFTLAFNNADLRINYLLQNSTNFIDTGRNFSNDTPHQLVIAMDFAKTNWSATLDNVGLVTNAPIITVPTTPFDLGDIDAVWLYGDPEAPGDNFMVFDNYLVTAESAGTSPPPEITSFQRLSDGQFMLRLSGESGRSYAIEATTNLTNWSSIRTNTASGGYFDFLDTAAPGFPRRFYRARLLP